MRRHRLILAVLVAAATVCLSASAFDMGMTWEATIDYMSCDQNSSATECAEWKTADGVVMMTCCIEASDLGSSDADACVDSGRARGRADDEL